MSEEWQAELVKQSVVLAFTTTGKVAEYLWKRFTNRVAREPAAVERAVRRLLEENPEAASDLAKLIEREVPEKRRKPRIADNEGPFVDRLGAWGQLAGRNGCAVLCGPPGIGKTALVKRFATETTGAGGAYPDGALLVDLADYRDGPGMPLARSRIMTYVLSRLGIETLGTTGEELAAQYEATLEPLRLLLVFDNAESAGELHGLIPPAPMSLILALTSGPADDFIFGFSTPVALGQLEPGADRQLLEQLCGAELLARDPQGVEALLAQCDRIPPAIVSAGHAARQRENFTPRPFTDVARELAGGAELGKVSRAYDELVAGLSPEAGELCRLLTAFPGPSFTPELVSVLLGRSGTQALIELQAQVLLTAEPGGRWRLGSQARQAVLRTGDTSGVDEAFARLLRFYVGRAVRADTSNPDRFRVYDTAVPASADIVPEVDWLAAEMPVLRALAAAAYQRGFHHELTQLCGALEIVPLHRNVHREFEAILSYGIAATTEPALLARMVSQHGRVLSLLGEFALAAKDFDRAEAELRRIPDPGTDLHQQLAASVSEFRALFHREQGQLEEALGYYFRALEISRRLSVPGKRHRGRGLHARMLANVLVGLGRAQETVGLLEEAEQNTLDEDKRNLAQVLLVRAKAFAETGQTAGARALLPEVWRLANEARSDQYDLEISEALGDAAWRAGDPDQARQYWSGVWQRYETARHPRRARLYHKLWFGS
ncbi:AAA family ATPase [Amycolatopsis jiangsuensis]|uniref:Tetratricopeptide (TPR) repeat protein n=1 Tax=Amycolatopsis jiangsuensis TaxID=1181879 RepID=A0A840J0U9_9PSEU|nr:AAA family ATPase [Amycolatopsis jiangsuensis]MBB4687062.1 tetratricopeptide (TPR) repeat protein [Amycolatopsis jiangsuensis]